MSTPKLQAILAAELTAADQFHRHATMLAAEGYHELAARLHIRSAEAAAYAETLAGQGINAAADEPRIGRGVKSMLENDLALEQDLVPQLTAAIRAEKSELLEKILLAEERHLDWLEAQLHLIAEIGAEDYCASQRLV